MKACSHHAAIDLGAESGRVILGKLEGEKISIEEIHRFPNRMREKDGGLRWDLRHLEAEILAGLKKIGDRKIPLDSVSTDSWGVDYVFLPEDGSPAKDPFCYRDGRNERVYPKVVERLGRERIFGRCLGWTQFDSGRKRTRFGKRSLPRSKFFYQPGEFVLGL